MVIGRAKILRRSPSPFSKGPSSFNWSFPSSWTDYMRCCGVKIVITERPYPNLLLVQTSPPPPPTLHLLECRASSNLLFRPQCHGQHSSSNEITLLSSIDSSPMKMHSRLLLTVPPHSYSPGACLYKQVLRQLESLTWSIPSRVSGSCAQR